VPTSTFKSLLLQENSAANKKMLCGRIFILSDIFNKVNTHRVMTAKEEMTKIMSSFGGEVKRSFLKNSTYLPESKSANTSKIKSATERQVEVANLWCFQKLLLG
jgi:hypothetical protein